MAKSIAIERKTWGARKSARALRAGLHEAEAAGRWLTAVEAAALTGVPFHLAEPAMLLLAGELRAELDSTDDGTLRFRFEDLSRDVFTVSVPPLLRFIGVRVRGVVKRAMKLGVGFTAASLAGLTMFVLSALTLFIPVIGPIFGGLLLMLAMLLTLPWLLVPAVVMLVALVLSQPTVLSALGMLLLTAPFVAIFVAGFGVIGRWYVALFNMVLPSLGALANFGGRSAGELEDEVAFTQLAQANGGRVTLGDLMILYGWSRDEAFTQATRLAVDYGGDVEVADDGELVLRFASLGDVAKPPPRPAPVWERELSPTERLGKAGQRAGSSALKFWAFCLVGLLVGGDAILSIPGLGEFLASSPSATAIASGIVFGLIGAVPALVLVRALMIRWRTARYARRRHALDALRGIFEQHGKLRMSPDDVDATTVLTYAGEVELTDETETEAKVEVRFPEIAAAATRWR